MTATFYPQSLEGVGGTGAYSPPSPLLPRRNQELLPPPSAPTDLSDAGEDAQALLPKHAVVRIVGNARTKAGLIGQRAIVRRAVGLGGWHWLVLSTGEEVKLQRNALMVLEYPTGNEPDFSDEEEEEERQRQLAARQAAAAAAQASSSVLEPLGPRQRRPPRPAIEDSGVRRMMGGVGHLSRPGQSRPNFSKLDTAALKRYRAFYGLSDPAQPNPSYDDALLSVEQHFSNQEVDEGEVLESFIRAAKRHHMAGGVLTGY